MPTNPLNDPGVDPDLRRRDLRRNLAALRKATKRFAWAWGGHHFNLAVASAEEIEHRAVALRLLIDGSYYEDEYKDLRSTIETHHA